MVLDLLIWCVCKVPLINNFRHLVVVIVLHLVLLQCLLILHTVCWAGRSSPWRLQSSIILSCFRIIDIDQIVSLFLRLVFIVTELAFSAIVLAQSLHVESTTSVSFSICHDYHAYA